MNTSRHIKLLKELFGLHGMESLVTTRLADHTQATIRIWPYAVSENRVRENEILPRAKESDGIEAPREHQRTHVLVLPSTIDAYDQARRIVVENPVLKLGEARVSVRVESVPLADISALFLASRVEYSLALCLILDEA
jgi:hypothetical protein